MKSTTWGMIGLAIVIAAFPMFFNFGDPTAEEQFGGTDAAAESIVAETNPDYKPWFEPLVGELPGEVESGLFAFQAALGAGVLGFALGNYRGRSRAEAEQESRDSANATQA
ncbi:energy-coupling factor ABC transporter substrate-binding protein [Corynebacterium sp.]|uniref:energy-coupling factor ABC transporter substrate-binding protein n=1 Tax=Corynebacterium sp. TaxID=1720 RepID=UPI0026DD5BAB|nr:energy-coupling factor ABC transporter substrate-binding protein [Corynebacterium sp.]MDO5076100.1 energy-coupling factor ABC transporter substrate-binding protein [Corynebacterium sp.]